MRRHVGKAKPSVAILAGLLGPPAGKLLNGGLPKTSTDLIIRLKQVYLNADSNGTVYGIGSIVQSDAVKGAVVGFGVHWIANLLGANRYLARMKFPVRI